MVYSPLWKFPFHTTGLGHPDSAPKGRPYFAALHIPGSQKVPRTTSKPRLLQSQSFFSPSAMVPMQETRTLDQYRICQVMRDRGLWKLKPDSPQISIAGRERRPKLPFLMISFKCRTIHQWSDTRGGLVTLLLRLQLA